MRYKPRIRTVLLLVNLVILMLPLFGIQALRLYESELIRQTEASLISQGVYIREQFLAQLAVLAPVADDGRKGPPTSPPPGAGEAYEPLMPTLDVAQERIRPRAEEAQPTSDLPEALASAAGRELSTLLARSQRYTLAGIRIVDRHGVVVATSRGELGMSLAHREEVRRALDGHTVSLIRERQAEEPEPPLAGISRGGRIRVFLGLPVQYGGAVIGAIVLSRTPVDIQKALYLNRYVLMRFAAWMLFVVMTVSALTATTISRPIAALIAQAQEVKNDVSKAAEPLKKAGSREILELSRAIAEMAQALQDRSNYVRTFAQHVSHEFKTPLAAFHGIVELLRDHLDTMSLAERSRFLDMLSADATRMQKLVERLLQLAKADVSAPPTSACEVATILAAAVHRSRDLGLAAELTDLTPPGLAVRMAAETLDSLVGNLLENAKQHGGANVKVKVLSALGSGEDRDAVCIVVSDDGPGIVAANLDRVFTPFFTTARETGGTGLGLSIVNSLVHAHGGRIALLTGEGGRGLAVQVYLPLVRPS